MPGADEGISGAQSVLGLDEGRDENVTENDWRGYAEGFHL